MKAKDECTGCHVSKNVTTKHCLVFLVKHKLGGCPCMNCLVKAMCRDTCETRKKYFSDINSKYPNEVSDAYHERHKNIGRVI